jgi:hypothetical protein
MTCRVDTFKPMVAFPDWVGELSTRSALRKIKQTLVNVGARRTVAQYAEHMVAELDTPLVERVRLLLRSLKRMRNLAMNWNSYGSQPPSAQAIIRSDDAVRRAFTQKCLPDAVVPSAEGGVALCWDFGNKHAYIEFDNDGSAVRAQYRTREVPLIVEFSAHDEMELDVQLDGIQAFFN